MPPAHSHLAIRLWPRKRLQVLASEAAPSRRQLLTHAYHNHGPLTLDACPLINDPVAMLQVKPTGGISSSGGSGDTSAARVCMNHQQLDQVCRLSLAHETSTSPNRPRLPAFLVCANACRHHSGKPLGPVAWPLTIICERRCARVTTHACPSAMDCNIMAKLRLLAARPPDR